MESTSKLEKVKTGWFYDIWNTIKGKINGYEALFWCALIAIVLSLVTLCAFLRATSWGLCMPANQEQWGQYGDFVGGVLGTLAAFISVYYLVRTLKEQMNANVKVSENNEHVVKMNMVQQFDNNYQQLLQLYHKAVADYSFDKDEKGKKALERWVSELQGRTIDYAQNYNSRLKDSLVIFEEAFYIPNRVRAAVHFRVLYQIFNTIEYSSLDKETKVAYAKLIRGQIDEDEMLLMRYNCWSPNGRKMRQYVNHYNLLKHLPILNLLEFYYWRQYIFTDEVSQNAIDTEMIAQRKWIIEHFSYNQDNDHTSAKVQPTIRYSVEINWAIDKKSFYYKLIRNKGVSPVGSLDRALELLKVEHTANFLADFLREPSCYSNFGLFNEEKDLNFVKKNASFDEDRQLEIFEVDVLSNVEMALTYETANSRNPDEHPEAEIVG